MISRTNRCIYSHRGGHFVFRVYTFCRKRGFERAIGKDLPTNVNTYIAELPKATSTSQTGRKATSWTTQKAVKTVAPTTNTANRPETLGQKNAIRSAKSYIQLTAFSYKGLISQLELEKYSHEDATYAADHCGADWNEQAARAAADYLEITFFSREELIKQLEFEGYTHLQAVYGVESVGY